MKKNKHQKQGFKNLALKPDTDIRSDAKCLSK